MIKMKDLSQWNLRITQNDLSNARKFDTMW